MIVKSTNHSLFYRKNGVVFEVIADGTEIPLYQFPGYLPDIVKLTPSMIDYLNKWLEYYPNKAKKFESKLNTEEGQLKLF